MAPYIVTVRRVSESHDGSPAARREAQRRATSRRAVATLDEAQKRVDEVVAERAPDQAAWFLPDSGGTVGPLADGTVIEVERVEWQAHSAGQLDRLVAAYNEAQGEEAGGAR